MLTGSATKFQLIGDLANHNQGEGWVNDQDEDGCLSSAFFSSPLLARGRSRGRRGWAGHAVFYFTVFALKEAVLDTFRAAGYGGFPARFLFPRSRRV